MRKNLPTTVAVDTRNNPPTNNAPRTDAPLHPMDDDRYPGSFFRVPGVPAPGKTTWSLSK